MDGDYSPVMRTVMVLAAFAAAVTAVPQAPREPWKLTLDARIALRTNAVLARERVRQTARRQPSSASSENQPMPWVDKFNGQTHPELFLPYQVFDQLMRLAFLSDPQSAHVVRQGFVRDVKRHGLPSDFWERLRAVSSIFIGDVLARRDLAGSLRQQDGPARGRLEEALELKHNDICRSRADALAAARREFGPERFDRFLYEVIATNMFHAADRLPDPKLLRQLESGCR